MQKMQYLFEYCYVCIDECEYEDFKLAWIIYTRIDLFIYRTYILIFYWTENVPFLQNAGAQAALQAAQQLMGSMEEPKTVLRVIVEHMLYPVTIDVLKQVNNCNVFVG